MLDSFLVRQGHVDLTFLQPSVVSPHCFLSYIMELSMLWSHLVSLRYFISDLVLFGRRISTVVIP